MTHRGKPVDPSNIRHVALLTIEGEHDDISGVGQTEAAHGLLSGLPSSMKAHWLQPGVGHYGVFNGSRFRAEIAPRIADFVLSHNFHRDVRQTASNITPLKTRRTRQQDIN
jgi:poly(3-hydroxybutyrate) depolymerase